MNTQFDFLEPRKPAPLLNAVQKLLADKAAYMRTAKWKKIRKAKLDQTRGQCEKCGSWMGRKDVHHKTYDRLGNERLEDLIVLCRSMMTRTGAKHTRIMTLRKNTPNGWKGANTAIG